MTHTPEQIKQITARRDAIESLPADQRRVIDLLLLEFSIEDIQALTGFTKDAIRVKIAKANHNIEEYLKNNNHGSNKQIT